MAKVRFAFYKAKVDGKLLDDAINIWTAILAIVSFDFKRIKYAYSHVEIWFVDEYGDFEQFVIDKRHYLGECFSSTTRGGAKGVRFAPASEVLKHPERWDYIECEVEDIFVKDWMVHFKEEVGKKYDFAGLFGFILPLIPQNENKWFCSELGAWVAFSLYLLKKWHKRISPRRLAKVLAQKYGEPKKIKG